MFFDVVASLKQFVDLDHLLANLVQVPAKNSLVSARAIQSAIANIVRECVVHTCACDYACVSACISYLCC